MILPSQMMLAVLLVGANVADLNPLAPMDPDTRKSYSEFTKTKELLTIAGDEPLQGLWPEKKKLQILKRVERVHREIVEPYLKAQRPDPRKIGLIAYYLINRLVETSYLIIPPESAFGQALDIMLPALSPWEGSTEKEIQDYEALNLSAQKQYRKIVQQLQEQGYYRGLQVE